MEENNGRTVETVNGNVTVDKLQQENETLKQYLNQAITEIRQLRNTWALQRAGFLFEVVKCDSFNTEFKMKAIEEIEEFLYPTKKEETEQVTENKE